MPNPNIGYSPTLTNEYPGLEGINTALRGFATLLHDPGYGQLTASQADDPAAAQYQVQTAAGGPLGAGAGLFGRLLAANMGADVAGAAAQDKGANAAQTGKVQANSNAANLMAGQQESKIGLEEAQNKQAGSELGGFSSILNMLTDPKGMGANIMSAFGGSGSPFSGLVGLFSKLGSMFGGGIPATGAMAGAVDTSGLAGFGSILDELGPAALAV